MLSTKLLAVTITAVMSLGLIATIQTQGFADNTKSFTCDSAKNCKAIFKKVNGDVIIDFTNSGGSGGNVNATDQVARNGVAELRAEDVNQNNKVDALTAENQVLRQNATDAANQIATLTDEVNTLKDQVANLTSQNPVIDVNVTNGTTPTTGGGGGTGGNTTDNGTGTGGNTTTDNGSGNGTSGNGTVPTGLNLQEAFNQYLIRTSG